MSSNLDSIDDYVKAVSAYATSKAPSSAAENAKLITSTIAKRFAQDKVEPDELAWHQLFSAFAALAQDSFDDVDAVQSRMVELLAAIKAQGVLEADGKPCKTQLGTGWVDLPFLGVAMRDAWNFTPPARSEQQWARLNAFAARVTAAGTHDFSLYAIWSIRLALEQPRPFSERDTDAGNAPPKSTDEAPISELLPAAIQWIILSGPSMAGWCNQGRGYKTASNQPDPAKLGKLATDAGLTDTGYNLARWNFWKRRLQQISETRDEAGGREKTAKLAYQGLEAMEAVEKGKA